MKPKFFIHIPKNAGMTIRRNQDFSFQVASPRTHVSRSYTSALELTMASLGDHHGHEHARWRDIKPELQQSHQFFAVIRNPWDRVVSRFFFAKKVIEVEKKVGKDYADVSSFEAFLEERHKWGNQPYMWHRAVRGWYPAHDHVSDTSGNIQCDMLRFENLDEDLRSYFKSAAEIRHRNVTGLNKQHYTDIYTPETIQIVADWYQKDIDTWGYDFDSGPTRNYWRP